MSFFFNRATHFRANMFVLCCLVGFFLEENVIGWRLIQRFIDKKSKSILRSSESIHVSSLDGF